MRTRVPRYVSFPIVLLDCRSPLAATHYWAAGRRPTAGAAGVHYGATVASDDAARVFAVVGIDHVQLAMPAGGEADAERFYGDVLGLRRVPKPPPLAVRGGC